MDAATQERIADLWASGKVSREIVEIIGPPLLPRHVEKAIRRLRLAGDPRAVYRRIAGATADRIRPLAAAGMTRAEIARQLGVKPKRITELCRRHQIVCVSPASVIASVAKAPHGVPAWVPHEFRSDYQRLMKLYGEENAASTIRKWKAEAHASC